MDEVKSEMAITIAQSKKEWVENEKLWLKELKSKEKLKSNCLMMQKELEQMKEREQKQKTEIQQIDLK